MIPQLESKTIRKVRQVSTTDDKRQCVLSLLENSLLGSYTDIVVETLMRIPLEDLNKVWEECLLDRIVILDEGDRGIAIDVLWQCAAEHDVEMWKVKGMEKPIKKVKPIKFRNWLIVLNERELKKLDKESQMSVIAHEFAHVFLKHSTIGWDANFSVDDEAKADGIIKKWGFKRRR